MSLVVYICKLHDVLPTTDQSACVSRIDFHGLARSSSPLQHSSDLRIDQQTQSSPRTTYHVEAYFTPLLPNQNPVERRRLSSTPLFPDA
jgi:hypothetical protein